jgi:hypothetical protein
MVVPPDGVEEPREEAVRGPSVEELSIVTEVGIGEVQCLEHSAISARGTVA